MGRKSGVKKGGGKNRSISNVKKANLRRNKLVKAGKLKPKSTPRFVEGGHLQKKSEQKRDELKPEELEERQRLRKQEAKEWEKEMYSEMADMIDPEDLEYLKSMNRMKKIPTKLSQKTTDDDDDDEYESRVMLRHQNAMEEEEAKKSSKSLLPIRRKDGQWVSRNAEVHIETDANKSEDEASDDDSSIDDEEKTPLPDEPVSVIDIVAKRRALLTEAKIQIGSMSSSFLELPEERLHILQKLTAMMNAGHGKGNDIDVSVQNTVAKLASASLLEIFKDTLPNYKIAEHEATDKTVKLKKDTLKLHKYESGLVQAVKSYLVKLCKNIRSTGKFQNLSKQDFSSAKFSLQCLCQLFVAHPNFNLSNHIVQFLVPYLNCGHPEFRKTVSASLEEVFRSDKKGEVSYTIVKQINHHIKTKKNHQRIHEELLMPLLSLKLYHLNNDQLTENPETARVSAHANKKLAKNVSKKNRHLVEPIMSKKEKKRAKERARLDRELLEAKGEESSKVRLKFATDITNILFAIYFRVLKGFTATHAAGGKVSVKLLHPVLNGFAKFGHLMSIEYFQDVLEAFKILLDDESCGVSISNYEKLLCLKTVFSILSGQGGNLTLDPARFYTILNGILLQLDLNDDEILSTSSDGDYFAKSRQTDLAISVLRNALIERRKKVAKSTVGPILKNTSMSMLQKSPDATLAVVKFLRECLFVAHPQMAPLLLHEGESEEDGALIPVGGAALPTSGERDPFGISSGRSRMWEFSLIANHASPRVSESVFEFFAKNTSQPRKRQRPLTIPGKVELENFIPDEIDVYFDILSTTLPHGTSNRHKKIKTK